MHRLERPLLACCVRLVGANGLYIVAVDETPPSDATIIWKGQMCASGKVGLYNVFRKTSSISTVAATDAALSEALEKAIAPAPNAATIGREAVVARALFAVNTDTIYAMKDKVNPPLSAEAWPKSGMKTDCSSFVAWCLRRPSKEQHPLYVKANGGWFETSAVYKDGIEQTGFFSSVETAQPGSLLVYPDRNGKQGHIGLVVKVNGPGIQGVSKVAHCSSGAFKKTGKAIALTEPTAWLARADSIIVDYEGFV